DRFVARDAGGERTIGGGAIVDPTGPQRFRRTPARLAALAAMAERDAAVALDGLLDLPPGIIDLTAFAIGRGLATAEIEELIEMIEPVVADSQGHRYVA